MGKVKRMLLDLEEDQLDMFEPVREHKCKMCGGSTSYAEWDAYFEDETIIRKVQVCNYCSYVEDIIEEV